MALQKCMDRTLRSMCARLEPPPSLSRSLSKDVIVQRVQERVLERDSWVPGEIAPDPKIMLPHWREMLFPKTPSQKELDVSFPVRAPKWEQLRSPPPDKIQCTWIGHSTMLVQMNGSNILTDPVFSDRCSPFQSFGPKRFRNPACSINDLKSNNIDVDVVLLSHNHYDHLDYESIKALASGNGGNSPLFVVPLGLKDWFRQHIPSQSIQIVDMDWHESIHWDDGALSITSVPMRHWSSRVGYDRDKTLWCGYVLESKISPTKSTSPSLNESASTNSLKFLFPGDTAWFDNLHEIGTRYGPFDLAGIPIGAYCPWEFMKVYHIDPPHAVKMMKAVHAKKAVPIHFGTFVLTFEPVLEPIEWLERINEGLDFGRWNIGDTVTS